MSSQDETFDACPAGQEVEAFHDRIMDGLLDALGELEERFEEIKQIPLDQRNPDEQAFLDHYTKVQNDLKTLKDPDLSYDKKYDLARDIQQIMLDMALL
ncbi:MAG: hypothetical protein HQL54_04855 [Magnetococcales bacterium]|nr:hypothetical protein [Magnetococcales bacterium]